MIKGLWHRITNRLTTNWAFQWFLLGVGVELTIALVPTNGGWSLAVNAYVGKEGDDASTGDTAPSPPSANGNENPRFTHKE